MLFTNPALIAMAAKNITSGEYGPSPRRPLPDPQVVIKRRPREISRP